jgi:bacterioferritin
MKGHTEVIEHLNALLVGELTAIDQYFLHSRQYQDWGLDKLYTQINHEMAEEQEHADLLIKRILFLEGKPDLTKRDPLDASDNVPDMLRADLAYELKVIPHLRKVIAFSESVGDFVTRDILLKLLKDTEEDHTWWLEKQLHLINVIGLPNYLQSQI